MNKNKVIELLKLIKNEKFYNELKYITNNENLKEEDIDYNSILSLTDDEIDKILNTLNLRLKAYKFYIYIMDKGYKKEEKEKLLKHLNDERLPLYLVDYLKKLKDMSSHNYNFEKQMKMIGASIRDSFYDTQLRKIIEEKESISQKDLPRVLESIAFAGNPGGSLMVEMTNYEYIMEHKDIARIFESISKCEQEENIDTVYNLLRHNREINKMDNLCYIIEQILKTTPKKAEISKEALENESIQKLCSVRNIIESIIEATNNRSAKECLKLAKNEKFQEIRDYYRYIEEIAKARGKSQAINGRKLIEYLLETEKINDFKTLLLLRGVTRAKGRVISNNALKAAKNEDLQKHKDYEEIIYNLGTYPKDIESSNYGLKIIETEELHKHDKLLRIVNHIVSDFGSRDNKTYAYETSQNKNLQDNPYLYILVETLTKAKTSEQSNLANKFLNDNNNKDLDFLTNIVCLIGYADTIEKSKIIYDLGYNPDIINLKEEGLAIMKEVYSAKSKKEIDFILNTKYNISNLGELIRLTKIFEGNSASIIKELEAFEETDINKDTIIRRR